MGRILAPLYFVLYIIIFFCTFYLQLPFHSYGREDGEVTFGFSISYNHGPCNCCTWVTIRHIKRTTSCMDMRLLYRNTPSCNRVSRSLAAVLFQTASTKRLLGNTKTNKIPVKCTRNLIRPSVEYQTGICFFLFSFSNVVRSVDFFIFLFLIEKCVERLLNKCCRYHACRL